jgi:hypothetical protein
MTEYILDTTTFVFFQPDRTGGFAACIPYEDALNGKRPTWNQSADYQLPDGLIVRLHAVGWRCGSVTGEDDWQDLPSTWHLVPVEMLETHTVEYDDAYWGKMVPKAGLLQ